MLVLWLLALVAPTALVAQTCGEQWTSFVVSDDAGDQLFSVAKSSGRVDVAKELRVDGKDVGAALSALEARLEAAEAELAALKAAGTPTKTFVHWGTRLCPTGSTLLYAGWVMGAKNGVSGVSTVHCVSRQADGAFDGGGGDEGDRSLLYAAEWRTSTAGSVLAAAGFDDELNQREVPCALCETNANALLLLPVMQTCPAGYTEVYTGYLFGQRHDMSPRDQLCVAAKPEGYGRETSKNAGGLLLYPAAFRTSSQDGMSALEADGLVDRLEAKCILCQK